MADVTKNEEITRLREQLMNVTEQARVFKIERDHNKKMWREASEKGAVLRTNLVRKLSDKDGEIAMLRQDIYRLSQGNLVKDRDEALWALALVLEQVGPTAIAYGEDIAPDRRIKQEYCAKTQKVIFSVMPEKHGV